YLEAKGCGLKPILGCEVYLAKTHHQDRESEDARTRYHLILLAQDLAGYHNLVQLVSLGCTEGFHYKPRVDKELLRAHSEGLIALSACLQGEVPRALLDRGFDAGLKVAREYEALFPGRFYLEVQANGLAAQDRLNSMLLDLAKETSLPLVATNDCHYLAKDDCEAQDVLLCVGTNSEVEDEKRMRMDDALLYYRPPAEMEKAFAHCPEALANTVRIAEACNVELPLGRHVFPVYDTGGKSLDDTMADMARQGLEARLTSMPYPVDADAYRARLALELEVIKGMGFSGYFLIVQDFINWAKDHHIPVGPGRGSAAGSLAAFALRITNLDPIPYNLLFERFLNPERISMPDIDVDFCERRRGEVIRYVSEKYGEDK
ncbi:MAG TPA: DNA polymerase III subunit alpha, partial [Spirochaetales bacterium]|nr:DNA polymerase III subunit alpha [Spirochaetales bacterium]